SDMRQRMTNTCQSPELVGILGYVQAFYPPEPRATVKGDKFGPLVGVEAFVVLTKTIGKLLTQLDEISPDLYVTLSVTTSEQGAQVTLLSFARKPVDQTVSNNSFPNIVRGYYHYRVEAEHKKPIIDLDQSFPPINLVDNPMTTFHCNLVPITSTKRPEPC